MQRETMVLLEYDKIIERLSGFAVSEPAKKIIRSLEPSIHKEVIEARLAETTEARAILDRSSSIPLHSLTGIEEILEKPVKGMTLLPEELEHLRGFLTEGKRLKRFLADKRNIAPVVGSYGLSFNELDSLAEEIDRCIRGGRVDDKASPELGKIRKKITVLEERIKGRLDSILKSPAWRSRLQDNLVCIRQGRYVVPVKSECRKLVPGPVLDTSASGATVFIEPEEVRKVQDDLNLLRIQEEKEVFRVLAVLTGTVDSHRRELSINVETMAQADFAFAKAKFSKASGGRSVALNTEGRTIFKGGRHPLLGGAAAPLDFSAGEGYRTLIITGPNTGGKTVALKTVGLMTLMVQSGLHVPVESGSRFAVFRDILADIGDGQSIEQSLSTFSSHVRNIVNIIRRAGPRTMVILDELGAGTDPQEGTGLAIAILERIYESGATLLATTHYSEIKSFAAGRPGYAVGCMEFDIETLRPLYRLKIGRAGESNALLIALRLGMDSKLIERAHEITYNERKDYSFAHPGASENGAPGFERPARERKDELGAKIEKARRQAEQKANIGFKVGDSVLISSMGRTGIVYEEANAKGEVGVMVMKRKFKVNQKRLSLYIEAEKLYPENYDLDIVLESKENRKKRKILKKRHVEGLTIHQTDK
ncbi:MAG: endonuclease MutS2 [Eubacteriales bacterium]